jgi:outer membrane protein W
MKTLLIILVALSLSINIIYAENNMVKNSKNNQALLFSLQGLGELAAVDYLGGIGYQYYITDKTAIRLALGFNSENETTAKPPQIQGDNDKENSLFSYVIAPAIKYNFASTSTICGFVGAELMYSYNSETLKYQNYLKTDPEISTSNNIFGAGLILGVEWFAWENLSLGAEYKIMFSSESGEQKTKTLAGEETITLPQKTRFGTGVSGYNLTISFYVN